MVIFFNQGPSPEKRGMLLTFAEAALPPARLCAAARPRYPAVSHIFNGEWYIHIPNTCRRVGYTHVD